MKQTRQWMLGAILLTAVAQPLLGQTAEDTVYVFKSDLPDAGYFLPAPPDTASMDFTDDMLQWQWGKTQRNTPRGSQASRESLWLPAMMRTVMAEVLELDTISDERTPALSRLLLKAYHTGGQSTAAAKEKYMRRRPFARMNEDTWGLWDDDFLRTNGSYPSGHTAFGWATALVFAEMWPQLQDTLLRRGFQFGENRIITGAHWQSDVNAGYQCAAAAIARAHANPELEKDILAARAEYARLKGLPDDYAPTTDMDLPHGERILNLPVDTASYRYLGDLMRYWNAKSLRDTDRGTQAIADVDKSVEALAEAFGRLLGITISAEATPALWQLISAVHTNSRMAAKALKATNFRKRPYVQLGEVTPTPEYEDEERDESSFASTHTCIGWAEALTLAEVAPERQDDILKYGFEFGQSRLILGYHWATDIEAARILAAAVVARLHADTSFRDLVRAARAEHEGQITGISSLSPTAPEGRAGTYRLNGTRATATTHGIMIQHGRKLLRPSY